MAVPKPTFKDLCKKSFDDQAMWCLNGFWADLEKDAEHIWETVQLCKKFDAMEKNCGTEITELAAHKLLETFNKALTVLKFRESFKEIDKDNNGNMSVVEYIIWKYGKSVDDAINAPQGTSPELEAAKVAFEKVAAQVEQVRAAIAELEKQEEEYRRKCEELEKKANDDSLSTVKKSQAANELAQLKNEDPLPLNKAKITLSAQERKLQPLFDDAKKQLDAAKKDASGGKGTSWWMDRQLIYAAQFLPKKKAEALLSPRGLEKKAPK